MTNKAKENWECVKIAIGFGCVALLGLFMLMAVAH